MSRGQIAPVGAARRSGASYDVELVEWGPPSTELLQADPMAKVPTLILITAATTM